MDGGDSAAFSGFFYTRTESWSWSFIYARPTATNADRYAAYQTYNELIFLLGRIPTVEEVFYMTAHAEGYQGKGEEYHGAGTFEGNFIEGLARNYWETYEACESGSSTCTSSKLYKFMSGYQPWFGSNLTPTERARHLLGFLSSDTYKDNLEAQITNILNENYAEAQGWKAGYVGNQPWQWHNWNRPPTPDEALGWIYSPNIYGDYFWIMTANQTESFQNCIKGWSEDCEK